MTKLRTPWHAGLALRVYWEQPGENRTAILCPPHREMLYDKHLTARGAGAYHPVDQCDACKYGREKGGGG